MTRSADQLMDDLLDRARAAAAPSEASLARAFEGVEARLRVPLPPELASPGTRAGAAGLAALPLGWPRLLPHAASTGERMRLAGWAALIGGIGFVLGMQVTRPAEPMSTGPVAVPLSPVAPPSPAEPELADAPSRAAAPPSEPPNAPMVLLAPARPPAPPPHPRPRARVHAKPAPAPRTTPSSRLSFEEVLSLLTRAERAQRRSEPEFALALLDDIDARADRETLRDERLVTRVLAACALGDTAVAKQTAAVLRTASPSSVYTSRLHDTCVDDAEANDDHP